jgi:hypothetical protein
MPHLSELQKKHAKDGVTIIGVSREDASNSLEQVKEMTAEKGDTMAYTVAWDDGGQTYAAYMDASGSRGIPTSFVVDGEGNIAYIGHPFFLDIPLARIAAGTWDAVEGPKEMAEMRKAMGAVGRYGMATTVKEAKALLVKIDDFKKRWPEYAESMVANEYDLLNLAMELEKASVLGNKMVNQAIKAKDVGSLNSIAWGIVDPEKEATHPDIALALYAATAACNLTEYKDEAILDTLARTHYMMGGTVRAIQLQRMAVEIAISKDSRLASSLEDALEEYLGTDG